MNSKSKKVFGGIALSVIILISIFSSQQAGLFQGRTSLVNNNTSNNNSSSEQTEHNDECPDLKVAEQINKYINNQEKYRSYDINKEEDLSAVEINILLTPSDFKIPKNNLFLENSKDTYRNYDNTYIQQLSEILTYNNCPVSKEHEIKFSNIKTSLDYSKLIDSDKSNNTFKITSDKYIESQTHSEEGHTAQSMDIYFYNLEPNPHYLDNPFFIQSSIILSEEHKKVKDTQYNTYESKHLTVEIPKLPVGEYVTVIYYDGIPYTSNTLKIKGEKIDICKNLNNQSNLDHFPEGILSQLIESNSELNELGLEEIKSYDFEYLDEIFEYANSHTVSTKYLDELPIEYSKLDPRFKKALSFNLLNHFLLTANNLDCLSNTNLNAVKNIQHPNLVGHNSLLDPNYEFTGDYNDYYDTYYGYERTDDDAKEIFWYDDERFNLIKHENFEEDDLYEVIDSFNPNGEVIPEKEDSLNEILSRIGSNLSEAQAISNHFYSLFQSESINIWSLIIQRGFYPDESPLMFSLLGLDNGLKISSSNILSNSSADDKPQNLYYGENVFTYKKPNINNLLGITPYNNIVNINLSFPYNLPYYNSYLSNQSYFKLVDTPYIAQADTDITITVQALNENGYNSDYSGTATVRGLDSLDFETDLEFKNGEAKFTVNLEENWTYSPYKFHIESSDKEGVVGIIVAPEHNFNKAKKSISPDNTCQVITQENEVETFDDGPMLIKFPCYDNVEQIALTLHNADTEQPVKTIYHCATSETCSQNSAFAWNGLLDNLPAPDGRYYLKGVFIQDEERTEDISTTFIIKNEAGIIEEVTQNFWDVPINHPYAAAINWMAAQRYIQGYQDGSFGIDKAVSRAELVKMVAEATHKTAPLGTLTRVFPDVQADDWFYTYVNSASSRQWVQGYPDGSFQPHRQVNRAEAIKIALFANEIPLATNALSQVFADINPDDWYFTIVSAALDQNLVGTMHVQNIYSPNNPYGQYYFPTQSMTRGEVAEMLYRMSQTNSIQDLPLDGEIILYQ